MNIATINVRGLGNPQKRKTLFYWLNERKFDIIALQETFCTENNVTDITSDWNGTCCHTLSNSSHSRGVSILFHKDFDFKIINRISSDDGRKLLVNIEHEHQIYSIACLYAPNDVNPRRDFLYKTRKWLIENTMNENCLIVCGDLNCSLNKLDRKCENTDNSRPVLKDFISYLDLHDSFRQCNKSKVSYTYSNSNGSIQSRIDYILCTQYVLNRTKKVYNLTPPRVPDHKAVVIKLNDDVQIGKGYFKLNISLLDKIDYIDMIKDVIQDTKCKYTTCLNRQQLWDVCKVRIREKTIEYCYNSTKNQNKEVIDIEKDLKHIDSAIDKTTDTTILQTMLDSKQELVYKINKIYEARAYGAHIRSRTTWIEKGEKNTKFFLNLETKRQTNNKISCILKSDGTNTKTSKGILQEGASFYRKLYNEKRVDQKEFQTFFDKMGNIQSLNDEDANICENDITPEECYKAIKKMGKNKTPGYDGLPVEFFTTFWPEIKNMILDSYNEAFREGELSEMQKQIILSLIYKKGDRRMFKNYRPISLSNVDYKILAYVLASRLQKVLNKLISPEQAAYVKDRYIGQNIRLLLDVIEYANKYNKSGVLLFLDFEKAFDSLNWDFIHLCLKKMGFKSKFCHWIKTIYTDPKAFLKINGFLSETINIKRGIRQGCPLSALIFILCTEYMAYLINNPNDIYV